MSTLHLLALVTMVVMCGDVLADHPVPGDAPANNTLPKLTVTGAGKQAMVATLVGTSADAPITSDIKFKGVAHAAGTFTGEAGIVGRALPAAFQCIISLFSLH